MESGGTSGDLAASKSYRVFNVHTSVLRKALGTTQMCDHINVQQKRTEAVQRHR